MKFILQNDNNWVIKSITEAKKDIEIYKEAEKTIKEGEDFLKKEGK